MENNFQANAEGLSNPFVLRIITKHVCGLKTDERILKLINELKTLKTWDILTLNETWRTEE